MAELQERVLRYDRFTVYRVRTAGIIYHAVEINDIRVRFPVKGKGR